MKKTLSFEEVADYIVTKFEGIVPQKAWGELSFFYNPDSKLPRGVYFCTIKNQDGANDKASHLNRTGVFRLNFGLPTDDFIELFGAKPSRPKKGGVIQGSWDFTQTDLLTPHPIYGWMGWVAVLNPSSQTLDRCQPLLQSAYQKSIKGYLKRLR